MCLNVHVTKYHAIRDQLLDRLEHMEAGEQFPPERDLAQELGVSRMTLRRALDELVARGVVRRRHGAGVFAIGPKMSQPLIASSFTEDMRERGLRPGARTLAFEISPAGARIARVLEIDPSAEVITITRLRLADDEPLALEELVIPRALLPDLTAQDLEDASFYALLRERFGIRVAHAVQTIEPAVLDAQEARDLGVPEHTPALQFERTSRDGEGRPVEHVRSLYRGDRYTIRTELALPQEGAR